MLPAACSFQTAGNILLVGKLSQIENCSQDEYQRVSTLKCLFHRNQHIYIKQKDLSKKILIFNRM